MKKQLPPPVDIWNKVEYNQVLDWIIKMVIETLINKEDWNMGQIHGKMSPKEQIEFVKENISQFQIIDIFDEIITEMIIDDIRFTLKNPQTVKDYIRWAIVNYVAPKAKNDPDVLAELI